MEDLKNLFNILFFVTMSVIAVLSYLQARKTLFSPIKTEIFKIQMEEFKSVLAFFNKRNSSDFDDEFGIHQVFQLNAAEMHHQYISTFFNEKVKPSEEFLERIRADSYGAIISAEFAKEYFEEITPGSELIDKSTENKLESLEPAMQLAKWHGYKHGMVHYTKKFHEKNDELSKLAASPLLPKELTDSIYEFSSRIHQNLSVIGETLTEESQQMQIKYTTAESAIRFQPDWIWNTYNHNRKDIDEISSKILAFINEHLKINEIMK